MATIKSYTDLSQSKKLAEILPHESADMHYYYDYVLDELDSVPTITEEDDHFILFPKDIRCWSLAALIGVLPKIDNYRLEIRQIENSYCCCYTDENNCGDLYWYYADNPVDACVDIINKLHKLNLL